MDRVSSIQFYFFYFLNFFNFAKPLSIFTRHSEPCHFLHRPREFIDCVDHMRLLSWLLLGSLTHTAITKSAGPIVCQPFPLEASGHIADHIMVIMTGFAEQSKVGG